MNKANTHIKLIKRIDPILTLLLVIGAILILFLIFSNPSLILTFVILGFILCLGFCLSRHVGWQTRENRTLSAKINELDKWGFASRDREGPWFNYIEYPLIYKSPLTIDKYFYSDWLVIQNGLIIVNPGNKTLCVKKKYASLQFKCSSYLCVGWFPPKRLFYWFALIGTPDWWHKAHKITIPSPTAELIDKTVFWQIALHASLVHDALYQYLDSIPMAKQDVDKLFYTMLLNAQLPAFIAHIYLFAVTKWGVKDAVDSVPARNSSFSCDTFNNLTS